MGAAADPDQPSHRGRSSIWRTCEPPAIVGIAKRKVAMQLNRNGFLYVLDRANGNQSRAADILGIHRNTLSRKIDEYKLDSNGHRRSTR